MKISKNSSPVRSTRRWITCPAALAVRFSGNADVQDQLLAPPVPSQEQLGPLSCKEGLLYSGCSLDYFLSLECLNFLSVELTDSVVGYRAPGDASVYRGMCQTCKMHSSPHTRVRNYFNHRNHTPLVRFAPSAPHPPQQAMGAKLLRWMSGWNRSNQGTRTGLRLRGETKAGENL